MCQKRDNVTKNECVYFLHDEIAEAVKIGHTVDLAHRASSVQGGNPRELVLLGAVPGGVSEEQRLHRLFADERLRGEWFRATDDLLRTVRTMAIRRGWARTVADELSRRDGCDVGLVGITVALAGRGLDRFTVRGAGSDENDRLLLDLAPVGSVLPAASSFKTFTLTELLAMDLDGPAAPLDDVPADRCFLFSAWPVECPCWRD